MNWLRDYFEARRKLKALQRYTRGYDYAAGALLRSKGESFFDLVTEADDKYSSLEEVQGIGDALKAWRKGMK